MICKACGAQHTDDLDICTECGAALNDDDKNIVRFVIGKDHDEPIEGNTDIDTYESSVATASDEYYGKDKKKKKPINRAKLAISITSVVLILLVILSCAYMLFDSLNRDKVPVVTQEDAKAIVTALNGPALSKIKDKFRASDSDSAREAARNEAIDYFKKLKKHGTIDSVEVSDDKTKIYFKKNYTESIFVMDDPTSDTYNASTVVTQEFDDTFNGIYSADRDLSNFKLSHENNILILNATNNHRAVYKDIDATLYYFEDANLNVNFIDNATLDNFLKDIGKYQMLIIHAQSFKDKNGKTVIALNEKATEANIVGYSAQLTSGQSSVYGCMMSDGASFTVTDRLIKENYKSSMPNSLVYLSMDYGYGNNNTAFAEAFISAGANAVVGYSDSVSTAYEANCIRSFTSYIIKGKTVADTYAFVVTGNGDSDGDETPAKFGYYGQEDWSLYGWELHSGTEATEITSSQELFDTLNYAMLSLGTNSLSKNILGYRILDADGDGSGELFMMTEMEEGLATNLTFDTHKNAKIALDTSKSEDYDFCLLYDSANSQVYLCEQFKTGSEDKTLYSWTNMGWELFAKYSDEKSGKPTYIWDKKNVTKEAFDANFKKASQGALLNNWRSMLNLYFQTEEREKTVADLMSMFKTVNTSCNSLSEDFDGDGKKETAIVLSGYGKEWLSNIAILSRTGKEPILYTEQFGTFVVYVDETDVGIVFRVIYLNQEISDKIILGLGDTGGVDVYFPELMKTFNTKFNGEITETAGYTVTDA